MDSHTLIQALIYLGSAALIVPIAVRLGLGSVLGYLIAGCIIGPWGLRLVTDAESILHFAEIGVVLMLFIIGLELDPQRLWKLRAAVFGGGALQMVICGGLLGLFCMLLGLRWQVAELIGMTLALSSTAIAMQAMNERNLMVTQMGRSAFAVLLFLIGYILVNGIPNLKPSLFEWTYNSDNVSLMPALINTILMTAFSLAIATPLGIFAAVWLVEYAKRGSKLVKVVRITTETLQGIPSIVYGLFGMLFFVMQLKWGYSLIAGAFTLAIMVLPVIMRTTEEALLAVPDSYREGSFGLGAGKLRTVFTIVLPSAMPGILSGVILATGRIVGETAALIYTASTVAAVPASVFNSTRTLATHMYLLSNEGLHINETYGTAVVLLILVLLINSLSSFIAGRLAKK